ncbi:MAG: DUF1559 domain-containing protein, partial [Planctomycetaceae bacterium]|nr:DUF1559 domain-containing protein [Planctomycetaceae bacterium]
PLYSSLSVGNLMDITTPASLELLRTVIPTYLCPSDSNRNPSQNTAAAIRIRNLPATPVPIGSSNYIAVSGASDINCFFGEREGMFFVNSNIRIRDLIDGTTNTWMVFERDTNLMPPRPGVAIEQHMGANWAGTSAPNCFDPNYDMYKVLGYVVPLYGEINGSPTRIDRREAASQHVGGIQVALADGSVRFVSENINLSLAQSLCRRKDGVVPGEW